MVLSGCRGFVYRVKPTGTLSLLNAAAYRHLQRLRALALHAAGTTGASRDRAVAYVAIETVNTWAEFTRTYYLSLTLVPKRYARSPLCQDSVRHPASSDY